MGRWVLLCALVLALPGVATAGPLGLSSCGDVEGVHQCSGTVPAWDGVPLDVTVTLPSAAARDLPLVADIHGFGNSKHEFLDPASEAYTGNAYGWARRGYAVLTSTARGLWGSCDTPDARAAGGQACSRGWIHLADVRYEVRDTQELIGRLVDEGVADPRRLGVTGDSYGGGQSLMLAALRDRVVLADGALVPWRTPRGTPLSLAAAAPVIPWTDLVSAIAPNGRTLSYAVMPQRLNAEPVGVFKTSFANAIAAAAQFATGPGQPVGQPFVPGRPMGYLAPPGADPQSDVLGWVARADAGEPYTDDGIREIIAMMSRFHSPYGIPDADPPPLFLGSGFTDDLFPVDEVLRFAERLRRDRPRTPLRLDLGDFGHQRAANKPTDRARLLAGIRAWFDAYVKRSADDPPASGVVASTQTCPRSAPSAGPFTAPTFWALARGEVRFASRAPQTVTSDGTGDPSVAAAVDPAAGGGDGCRSTRVDDAPATAAYRLPPSSGYTLLGAPTVSARLRVTGSPGVAQLALRLWDVAPGGGSQTLVARGTYRPVGRGEEVFQLHPNGWRFAPGHVARLEVLGADAPYTRASNGTFSVEIERLTLRLPVRDTPDCSVVQPVSEPVVPAGQALARGVSGAAPCTAEGVAPRRPRVLLRLRCSRGRLVATARVPGFRVRRMDFFVGGRRVARDTRAPFARRMPRRATRVTARAALRGRPSARGSRRIRRCRAR